MSWMSWMRHHAIIVTSFNKDYVDGARKQALELFDIAQVSEIITGVVNCYYTFLIGPDGSKENWDTSDKYDGKRESFIEWLQQYDGFCTYVEVQYGCDYGCNRILKAGETGNE